MVFLRKQALVLPMVLLASWALSALNLGAAAQSTDQLFRDALAAEDQGQLSRAIALYEELTRREPNSVPVRANLGEALARAGRYDEAVAQYQEALKRDPRNFVVRLNLALARYKQADFGGSAERLELLRAEQPENRQILYLLADCYLRLGRNSAAAKLLRPVYEAGPDDRAVDYALGTALVREGKVREGELVLDRILRDGGSSEATLLLGEAQLFAGEHQKAAVTLRKICDSSVSLPSACSLYGRALLKAEDIPGGKAAFGRALQLDQNDFDANLYLGAVLRREGNAREAKPFLERALRLRPASPQVRFQIAALDAAEARLEKARGEFEELAQEWPDFLEVHVQLAALYARMNLKPQSMHEQNIVRELSTKERSPNTPVEP